VPSEAVAELREASIVPSRPPVLPTGSIEDGGFTEENAALLDQVLTAAGVPHTVEIWPGHHGFAVADMPVYDAALEERHWEALRALYGERLAG
jgi:carboxymethylenebutenolidase